MPIMRGQWAELLGPGLNFRTFQYRQLPEFYRQINRVETTDKSYEDDWRMAGFGPLGEKTELGTTLLDEPIKIGGVRFFMKTFALGFVISREMRDDSLYPQIANLATELGKSSYWTTELYGHDVWNNAFSNAKYAGRDGLALCHTAHPIQGLGTTVGNRPAVDTDISEAALAAAIQAYETQVNERGMPVMARATRLLHHPSERFNVARLLNSTLRPGGNNNDINVLQGENIQPISDPWLTDPDAWFLIGSPDDIDVRFYWRDQPDTTTWDDQNTDATFHKIRQRHGVGFGDWRGVYGSPGA